MNAILDKMEIGDVPAGPLREVATVIGISKFKELIIKCPGVKIYIPKSVRTISNLKYCRDHFTGDNHRQIADHLGITKRSVYRLLKRLYN